MAKRRQLEEKLAQAREKLDDTYYDRSVSDQQTALDKEAEAFKDSKDKESEALDKWLKDEEKVLADSMSLVIENQGKIFDTLIETSSEYGIQLSDAIIKPWDDANFAAEGFQNTFQSVMSSSKDAIQDVIDKWNELFDKMDSTAKADIKDRDTEVKATETTQKPEPEPEPTPEKPATNTNKAITVGSKINAGSARIYGSYNGAGGGKQYFGKDPIYVVLGESNGYLKVRYHKLSSGTTGYFKKSDVKAYAKGTTGVDKSQLALIDELGEELVLHASENGRLQYLAKGSGVVPADLTSNLMDWGKLNPQDVLDRNRPTITASASVHPAEVNLTVQYGDVLKIENFNGNNPEEISKLVAKQLEKHTKDLNNSLRKYVR